MIFGNHVLTAVLFGSGYSLYRAAILGSAATVLMGGMEAMLILTLRVGAYLVMKVAGPS